MAKRDIGLFTSNLIGALYLLPSKSAPAPQKSPEFDLNKAEAQERESLGFSLSLLDVIMSWRVKPVDQCQSNTS